MGNQKTAIVRKRIAGLVQELLDEIEARRLVKEAILMYEEEVDEISTTGATPGYQTPMAFRKGDEDAEEKMKKQATQGTGMSAMENDKMNEIKKDLRRLRSLVDKVNKRIVVLREHSEKVDSESFTKDTVNDIFNIEEILIRISEHMREAKR